MIQDIQRQWLEWINLNLISLRKPAKIVEIMLESGQWNYEEAAQLIDQQLVHLNMDIQWRLNQPRINPKNLISIDNRDIRVTARLFEPEVVLMENVLSHEECDQLIEMAFSKGLSRSNLLGEVDGKAIEWEDPARTSTSIFFRRSENPFINAIENRISQLTNWPLENGEGLQVACYRDSQEFKPHFDWFDPNKASTEKILMQGGQRVSTTIFYLKCPEFSGATVFPGIRLEVTPSKGGAIFFKNVTLSGEPNRKSLHGGKSVNNDVKIIAVYWQRESEFVKNDG